ncbi:MAG: hypothetical protein H0X29_11880 [Parachlamydiaceae bacterium]|nr:hypothetical protein [Parachlamydiaceae bacterium]
MSSKANQKIKELKAISLTLGGASSTLQSLNQDFKNLKAQVNTSEEYKRLSEKMKSKDAKVSKDAHKKNNQLQKDFQEILGAFQNLKKQEQAFANTIPTKEQAAKFERDVENLQTTLVNLPSRVGGYVS